MIRILVLTAVCALTSSIAAAQTTAIRAGRLVDVEAGRILENQIVLVEGATIKAVGSDVAVPPGANVIDLSRATVMPGLFDAHTHLCIEVIPERDHGEYYYTTLNDPDAFRAIEGVVNARAMLEAGFTSVRDVGNEGNYACSSVRLAIQRRMISGPTIVNAGRIIAPYGGQFHLQPTKRQLAEPEYFFADTRDEMIKGIRENIHYGARVIKVVVDDQRYIYSAEDLRFIVDEAGRAGLKVAAHAWTEKGARHAAEAGVASIEHGFDMPDEVLALARKNGVALVGTEFVALEMPADMRGQWIDRLRRAHRIGVKLVYGTDVMKRTGGETRGTLAMSGIDPWIEAGIPPIELLRAMTTNAAELLGIAGARGSIRPGLSADLIATPDNPLENVKTLMQVTFVMKDGVVVKSPGVDAARKR